MRIRLLTCCVVTGFIFFATVTNGQNVGIGTATPGFKLDVEGRIRAKEGFMYLGTLGNYFATSAAGSIYTNADFEPLSTNAYDLGTINYRWGTAFVSNLNINQSILSNGQGGNSGIFLGNGLAGKEANAGRIGYALFTANTLDIIGGGTNLDNRRIRLWAEDVTEMTGDASVFGNLNVAGKVTTNATGTANVVPIAIASIDALGLVVSSTGNVSVVKTLASGLNEITISGQNINLNNYIIEATALYVSSSDDLTSYGTSIRILNGKIRLYTLRGGAVNNNPFSLIVYKLN